MLSKKELFGLAQLFLQECQNCRLHVQRNFSRKFSLRKFFGFCAKFFWIFEEVLRLEKHNCLLGVSFQRNSPKNFFLFFGILTKNFPIFVKNVSQGCRSCILCVYTNLVRKGERRLSFIFFGLWGQLSLIYGKSIPAGVSKLHSICPRERCDENSVFFETFVFFSFSENVWIFSRFSRNFLARLSMLQGSCLEEQFEDKFCSEKKLIYQLEMLSGKFAEFFFCKSVKTAVYVSKGKFRGNFL